MSKVIIELSHVIVQLQREIEKINNTVLQLRQENDTLRFLNSNYAKELKELKANDEQPPF